MNVIRKHVPNFIDQRGMEIPEIEFEEIEEILALDWVDRWAKKPNFYRFSVSTATAGHEYGTFLMAELNNGENWNVVGRFKTAQGISLPEWESPCGE